MVPWVEALGMPTLNVIVTSWCHKLCLDVTRWLRNSPSLYCTHGEGDTVHISDFLNQCFYPYHITFFARHKRLIIVLFEWFVWISSFWPGKKICSTRVRVPGKALSSLKKPYPPPLKKKLKRKCLERKMMVEPTCLQTGFRLSLQLIPFLCSNLTKG